MERECNGNKRDERESERVSDTNKCIYERKREWGNWKTLIIDLIIKIWKCFWFVFISISEVEKSKKTLPICILDWEEFFNAIEL